MKYDLLNKYSHNLDVFNILKDYPRPQFKRDSYINLNGEWEYIINNDGNIDCDFKDKIIVPFCAESHLSGVNRVLKEDEYLIYKKEFIIDNTFVKDITLLHFEAVDQICEVYLNGKLIGINEGGYLPFCFDISDSLVIGDNVLIVKVKDELNVDYPYGKQRKKRGGMWYTPVSGIWGSVWLESVNINYIKDVKLTPNVDDSSVRVEIDSESSKFNVQVKRKGEVIYNENVIEKCIDIKIDNVILWSPENPFLYDLVISCEGDTVESYFAMRKFSVNNGYFYLNNKPYFVNGVLDQGYFSDGIYTPSSYEVFKDDILSMKNLGFNTLRKHIKIESKMFYYYCDLYGMLVFQDMVNVGEYSFIRQTLLPGFGVKRLIGRGVTEVQKDNFIKHTKDTLKYLYNVSSIVCYTIFNEGWGQFDSDKLYDIVKECDDTRVIDSTSGWFKENKSDVESLHVYFRKIVLKKSDKPLFVSEFGGYSYKVKGHNFNDKKTFAYRIYKSRDKFERDFIRLYRDDILFNLNNKLAGSIYTQLSDVEDETNGLLTYDREVCKVDVNKVKNIMEEIYNKFKEITKDL